MRTEDTIAIGQAGDERCDIVAELYRDANGNLTLNVRAEDRQELDSAHMVQRFWWPRACEDFGVHYIGDRPLQTSTFGATGMVERNKDEE